MKLFIIILSLFVIAACTRDPYIWYIKQKYPHCDILKIEDDFPPYKRAIIQCPGNRIKKIRIKEN